MSKVVAPVDLSDADLFAEGAPHALFRRLRRDAPVYWNAESGGGGFWAVLRHADVLAVSRDAETFSSGRRGIVIFDASFEKSGRAPTMMEMEPEQHGRLRAIVNRGMTPRRILALEDYARGCFARVLDRGLELGRCNFVEDIAGRLPLEIITEMMGVPEADRSALADVANRVMGFEDPQFADAEGDGGGGENVAAIAEMASYARDLARERRRAPAEDIASAILQAEVDGVGLDDEAFASFFMLLITAGIETTKSAISGGTLALLERPEQWEALRKDARLLPSALEEMIRWTTPIHYFRRTATRSTRIGDQPVEEGDKVVIWYSSANRDEAVFDEPDEFDITRTPNDHLSFGFGRHYCLGANLARLEMRVVFETLLSRDVAIEPFGEVAYLRSTFTHSLKEMPVELMLR